MTYPLPPGSKIIEQGHVDCTRPGRCACVGPGPTYPHATPARQTASSGPCDIVIQPSFTRFSASAGRESRATGVENAHDRGRAPCWGIGDGR
jgi:hypothetical protein